jgi:hypothetical protein
MAKNYEKKTGDEECVVFVRCSTKLKEKIKKHAEKDRRSVQNFLVNLLETLLKDDASSVVATD